ncbi:hypothetical protein FRC06_006410 [Ceratobasidium sp. 370]|nr:hypothetical protein FRC06_006410 [Ceratobasidium sp. 370]
MLAGGVTRSKEADVYALGMELVTEMVPFSDKTDMAVYGAVVYDKRIPSRPEELASFAENQADLLWGIMVDTWAYDPSSRPDSVLVRDRRDRVPRASTKLAIIRYPT